MVYFTWSEGFRAGGVNLAHVEGIPKYGPNFVTNYEFGWKTTLADGAVRFNGAVYLLDWDDYTLVNLSTGINLKWGSLRECCSVQPHMHRNTGCITQSNGPCPFQMSEKSIVTASLSHDCNACCRANR